MSEVIKVMQTWTDERKQRAIFFTDTKTYRTIYSGKNHFSAIEKDDLEKNYPLICVLIKHVPAEAVGKGYKITSGYSSVTPEDFNTAYEFTKENEDKRLKIFGPFMQETALFE
ncbi:hypothetical protein HYZ41_01465 [archaeon]|nr:hypothetical protein [archaeon]